MLIGPEPTYEITQKLVQETLTNWIKKTTNPLEPYPGTEIKLINHGQTVIITIRRHSEIQ